MNKKIILFVTTITCFIIEANCTQIHSRPSYSKIFCNGNDNIYASYDPGLSVGYRVYIEKKLTAASEIKVKLDSEGSLKFGSEDNTEEYQARFTSEIDIINNVFSFVVLKDYEKFLFTVKGKHYPHHPPYILSLRINGEENCKDPDRTYFQSNQPDIIQLWPDAPDKFCGRRRVFKPSLELIVSGAATWAGNWPWHAAIYKMQRSILTYICGGTLISKFLVLTAAHCATVRGVPVNPDILGVILGKYSLIGSEITTQDREVYQVIIHEDYDHKTKNNDIALLKLSTEAVFNNYVQPACIWLDKIYDKMDSFEINGTIVGWGFDNTDHLAKKLRETTIPIIPDLTCIRYEPIFYTNLLNGKKFCAGHNNGTAACNGDSGGGMLVFVEDNARDSYYTDQGVAGAWYIRGIVSITLARGEDNICDPKAYTVLTDVAKYRDWILNYMK